MLQFDESRDELKEAKRIAEEFLMTDWSQDFDVKAKLKQMLGFEDVSEDWDEPEDISFDGSDRDTITETTKSRFFG